MTSLRSPEQAQSVGQEEGRVSGWEGVHRARHSDICCTGVALNIRKRELNCEPLNQELPFLGHVVLEEMKVKAPHTQM